MSWYGKTIYLIYDGRIIVNYKIYCVHGNTCEVELNLYYPFNRHRAILNKIRLNDVHNAILSYMELQAYRDTEDCNKLQAYEVVEYFKSKIDKESK